VLRLLIDASTWLDFGDAPRRATVPAELAASSQPVPVPGCRARGLVARLAAAGERHVGNAAGRSDRLELEAFLEPFEPVP
jgi:hypothetical protein